MKPNSNYFPLLTSLILPSATPPSTNTLDGFTHLTEDATLLLTVANHFYKSTNPSKPWLCLQLDPAKLSSKVVFEAAAPVGDTKTFEKLGDEEKDVPLFPHLYGPINLDSVTKELEVVRNIDDGSFLAIQGL